MKILLVAYACEPNRGSEPGVGWQWVLNLSKDKQKEVYVLTRSNNKDVIDDYWANSIRPENIHFFYYDLPASLIWAKHHGLPVNLYYALWLIGSVDYAKRLHEEYRFDMAHHITFGVFRDPCPIYKLNIPYVVGPVGGGEVTPPGLMCLYSEKEKCKEWLRGMLNKFALYNPVVNKCFNHASLVLTKTQDTKDLLAKWADKTIVNLELGIKSVSYSESVRDKNLFLFVGRFTYWKGVKLVLKAFDIYAQSHPDARLLLIGKGEMEGEIRQYAKLHNLNIEIVPWIKQEELKHYYSSACAMLFPSLHDSSGNVVLESLSFGLPVICLDCGGPASVLGKDLQETVIATKNVTVDDVVNGIVEKMNMLVTDEQTYLSVQEKGFSRAESLQWETTVECSYKKIESVIYPG